MSLHCTLPNTATQHCHTTPPHNTATARHLGHSRVHEKHEHHGAGLEESHVSAANHCCLIVGARGMALPSIQLDGGLCGCNRGPHGRAHTVAYAGSSQGEDDSGGKGECKGDDDVGPEGDIVGAVGEALEGRKVERQAVAHGGEAQEGGNGWRHGCHQGPKSRILSCCCSARK